LGFISCWPEVSPGSARWVSFGSSLRRAGSTCSIQAEPVSCCKDAYRIEHHSGKAERTLFRSEHPSHDKSRDVSDACSLSAAIPLGLSVIASSLSDVSPLGRLLRAWICPKFQGGFSGLPPTKHRRVLAQRKEASAGACLISHHVRHEGQGGVPVVVNEARRLHRCHVGEALPPTLGPLGSLTPRLEHQLAAALVMDALPMLADRAEGTACLAARLARGAVVV
jgi:hypothetical protein